MTGSPAVEVRDVSVSYGGVKALSGVHLVLRRSEVQGLIGPNGAGKSTLVGVIAGTVTPRTGTVTINGTLMRRRDARSASRAGLARTFQHPAMFGTLTVSENLDLGVRWRRRCGRKPTTAQDQHLRRIPESLGLLPWLSALAQDVPHPVQRLVETARAMLTAAPVLLLDEPAAGLGEAERESLVAALRAYREVMEASVLLVEHDVPLVLDICDRVTVLHEGTVLAASTSQEIRKDPRVIDAYFGAQV